MATWTCPNCQTVQVDSAQCFLCGRSATSCGTCVNFRSSFVGGLGYCGLDRAHAPLNGDERRSCWSGTVAITADGVFSALIEQPADSHLVELKPLPAAGAH
jgi:hypothetical protein